MRKKGVALITVLMAATVLAMLSASLVLVTRASLVSGEQVRRRQVILKCAYSGLDYARARLAQVQGWSKVPFGNATTLDDNHLRIQEQGNDEASNLVVGEDRQNGGHFRVRILNNLRGLAALDAPLWSRTKVKVAPHCAMVLVEADFEGSQRHIEAVLTKGSLLTNSLSAGDSVAANVTIGASADVMQFSSSLPRGNVIKAKNKIVLPKITQVKFKGGNGAIQSGGNVAVNASVAFDSDGNFTITAAGTNLQGNATATAAASTQMQANIRTGSQSNQSFNPDKLVQPGAGPRQILPGTYTFVAPDQVTYKDENGVSGDSDLTGKVALRDFRFIPLGNVEVVGNLTVEGMVPRATWVNLPGETPHWGPSELESTIVSLGVGYDSDGIPKAAQDNKDRLTVNGELKVKGDLVGNGQIFVNKNNGQGGNLTVMGNSFTSSTRTDGMAVVTQGSAKFTELDSAAASLPAYMAPKDLPLFQSAILSEYLNAASATVFDQYHQSSTPDRLAMVGSTDHFGDPGLRNQPAGNGTPKPLASYGGIPLHQLALSIHNPAGGSPAFVPINAKDLVSRFIDDNTKDATGQAKPLTLGNYIRIREFLKSVDLGAPKVSLLDSYDPTYSEGTQMVTAAILNQVQAYDQDARNNGKTLGDYMQNLAVSGGDPYLGNFSELIFGGLLYAEGNLFTNINNTFNLYGAMIAKGNIGFNHLQKGRFVFDPSLVEEQFELSQLGLVPVFFWTE